MREDGTRHRRIRYREMGRTKRAGGFPALLQFLISDVAEGGGSSSDRRADQITPVPTRFWDVSYLELTAGLRDFFLFVHRSRQRTNCDMG